MNKSKEYNKHNISLKQKLEENYIMEDTRKDTLKDLGFRYSKLLSDEEEIYFVKYFPVDKYKEINVINCELYISVNTGELIINTYNSDQKQFFPFYNIDYIFGYEKYLNKIESSILKEFRKLGISKIKRWYIRTIIYRSMSRSTG